MENVLVLFETDPAFREELKRILHGYRVIFNEKSDTTSIEPEIAKNTAVIFGNPGADFLRLCPHLQWLQLQSAGSDKYVNGEVDEKVLLTCASGCYGHAVSEHMLALTFELLKKLHLYRDEQALGCWRDRGEVKSIQDSVVLAVGLGDIGANYARRVKALGAYVIGIRRTAHAKPDYLDKMIPPYQFEEVLPKADIVALAVPETRDTAGLVGRTQLAKMKRDAVIINAGRGSAVDIDALCDALESGSIGGAGLDVTVPEPLPSGHRLWKLQNAVVTPHVAGGLYLRQTGQYLMRLNLENAARFMRGQSLKSRVDLATGYRIPED